MAAKASVYREANAGFREPRKRIGGSESYNGFRRTLEIKLAVSGGLEHVVALAVLLISSNTCPVNSLYAAHTKKTKPAVVLFTIIS